ncbi:MAG: alpha-D-ribose 1-methylphosphonate 5-triphosphate diphosphatase [Kiloniellales bacterium]|nr:alpha-D-ribose 1-methylphosphonate 5-triphosphate diphosphatase [Kiloniellales bacterium]
MSDEKVLTNARIVLADEVVTGTLVMRDGRIEEIDRGSSTRPGAEDLEGDYLVPGLIELHTDNLEGHLIPRPGVKWPTLPALMAHDALVSSAGITTVLDALRIGDRTSDICRHDVVADAFATISQARSDDVLRADHLVHMRCEVTIEDVVEQFEAFRKEPLLRMVSLMDHTPGQRQFADIDTFKAYYGDRHKMSEAELQRLIESQTDDHERYADANRARLANSCQGLDIALASHDDATEAHVDEASALGLTIAEFPTTVEAASAAQRKGMTTIAGAPNVVRGGSHSGNVSALELAAQRLLDCLSSDYAPVSLLHGAFILHEELDLALPEALATVTRHPAEMIGLDDRGVLAPGKRADLVRVQMHRGLPVVRCVWRTATRVV